MGYPDICSVCGSRLDLIETKEGEAPNHIEEADVIPKTEPKKLDIEKLLGGGELVIDPEYRPSKKEKHYALQMADGTKIVLPNNECIVGRSEEGAKELAPYQFVSRKHMRIKPFLVAGKQRGIEIEDISSGGTYINGEAIGKFNTKRAKSGDTITLYKLDLNVVVEEE